MVEREVRRDETSFRDEAVLGYGRVNKTLLHREGERAPHTQAQQG